MIRNGINCVFAFAIQICLCLRNYINILNSQNDPSFMKYGFLLDFYFIILKLEKLGYFIMLKLEKFNV